MNHPELHPDNLRADFDSLVNQPGYCGGLPENLTVVEAHRGWFAMKNWTLSAKPVEIYEDGALGVAVLHLDYREDAKTSESYLTLVFENRGGEWLMVQDQNAPIQ